jgi:molecular chaperone HscA
LAERAKKELSRSDLFEQELLGTTLRITRTELEALIEPLLNRTLDCCRNVLRDAKLTPEQIGQVVLVGGSTRVPLVKQRVSEFFGRPAFDNIDPDEIVALGAAIQADVLAGNQQDILLLDITPLSLGIETVGGLMDTIIPRNSKIPTKAGRQYTTSVDGQINLKVSVFKGERDLVEHKRKLGEFILRNIPPMPAGLPKVQVSFQIDADGILRVSAKELRSGLEQSILINEKLGLDDITVELMIDESIQQADADRSDRLWAELKVEAEQLSDQTISFLEKNKAHIKSEELLLIQQALNSMKLAMNVADPTALRLCMDELDNKARPVAERVMDLSVAEALKGRRLSNLDSE